MLKKLTRLLLLPFTLMRSGGFLAKAKKFEKEGKHKEACYEYAIVLLNGGLIGERELRDKIKELWATYGPFNFEDELKKEIDEHGDTPEHCAEAGHAATMSIIKEVINEFSNGARNKK